MFRSIADPRPRPRLPEAVIITVVILSVTVLVITGMKPADAVLVIGCAGLFGAAVVRACTTSRLTALLRPAWAELQARPA
ncbi:hypothetical protein ACFU6S_44735 [Streptomyces sp. NPDC057456]|uniref:hypothetical protein n=1 Tax=Streptomyces sp. NPDC057456 TaxID=3346139 RepID=UPI0036B0762A